MSENTKVKFETTMGDIVMELYPEKAPITVENFLTYVKDDFFSETIFHRVIPNFMVQGGGMLEDMTQKTTRDMIKIEADNGLSNDRGTVAMARTMIPDSATAQFF
ncbi:MAG: peptidylprolyl isomerase, partial [Gammaproteobacteria bacterium]|nr:peptidylprolyl isomerase [Gammaproteobacteria bacterium]